MLVRPGSMMSAVPPVVGGGPNVLNLSAFTSFNISQVATLEKTGFTGVATPAIDNSNINEAFANLDDWTNGISGASIDSGTLLLANDDSVGELYNTNHNQADGIVSVEFIQDVTGDCEVFIGARGQTDGDGIYFGVIKSTATDQRLVIIERVSSVNTVLVGGDARVDAVLNASNTYRLILITTGTQVVGVLYDVTAAAVLYSLTAASSASFATDYAMLARFTSTSGYAKGCHLDNFTAGDLVADTETDLELGNALSWYAFDDSGDQDLYNNGMRIGGSLNEFALVKSSVHNAVDSELIIDFATNVAGSSAEIDIQGVVRSDATADNCYIAGIFSAPGGDTSAALYIAERSSGVTTILGAGIILDTYIDNAEKLRLKVAIKGGRISAVLYNQTLDFELTAIDVQDSTHTTGGLVGIAAFAHPSADSADRSYGTYVQVGGIYTYTADWQQNNLDFARALAWHVVTDANADNVSGAKCLMAPAMFGSHVMSPLVLHTTAPDIPLTDGNITAYMYGRGSGYGNQGRPMIGVVARFDTATGDCYVAALDQATGGSGGMRIYKYVSGVFTQLAFKNWGTDGLTEPANGTLFGIGFDLAGESLTMTYYDAAGEVVTTLAASNGDITDGGSIGLESHEIGSTQVPDQYAITSFTWEAA